MTINLDDLRYRLRMSSLDIGSPLHPETTRMLACDSQLIPIVLKTPSQPLDVGHARRPLNAGLRRAPVARAGGCCEMPGCGRPASWCDGHHEHHWVDGGATALHNLVLLCKRHHRLVHRLDPDGHLVFTPPEIIDPNRTPRPSRLRC